MSDAGSAAPPRATYRLQLTPTLGFREAADVCDYLAALGVSHLYSSPILQARSGSEHGYDVVDPSRLDEARGGEAGFRTLAGALGRSGLALLLDIVPNHMAASHENRWWWDVLRHGPASLWADHFDIDWWPAHLDLRGAVILPVLGDHYGPSLKRGELSLRLEKGVVLRYFDRRLPMDPATLAPLLHDAAGRAAPEGAGALRALADELRALPGRDRVDPESRTERAERTAAADRRLAGLVAEPGPTCALKETLAAWNGRAGDPSSFDRLDALLSEQAYRLVFWKVAAEEINFRRFFDIGDLVALRVERAAVFRDSHTVVERLAREGVLHGVRVDHVDGLRDPQAYLEQLTSLLGRASPYRVVEKILAAGEEIPDAWPVDGTTGYEFLNALNAIFVDAGGLAELDRAYAAALGEHVDFADLLYRKKRQVILELFAGELRGLERLLSLLARHDRQARDLAVPALGQALLEVSACLPVYRTYWRGWASEPSGPRDEDRAVLRYALDEAKRRARGLDEAALDFVGRCMGVDAGVALPKDEWEEVVLRWQQFTGPATAKGLEDTTLYLFNRLVSMNAVGSEPGEVDVSFAAFHSFQARRAERWPAAMSATSTHDSKRSEDVRARINVLSELADEWATALAGWRALNAGLKERVDGTEVPHPNAEILLYQTLLGSWPLADEEWIEYPDRVAAFMVKAAREAKVRTAWLSVDEAYEAALDRFVRAVLGPEAGEFRQSFLPLQHRVARLGALNSLSQVLLKCAAPGVPDFYQGTELWDLSLVDPDNRRPVDFRKRRDALAELDAREADLGAEALASGLLEEWRTGAIKLWLTRRCLAARSRHAGLFGQGSYEPLLTGGARGRSAVAFVRRRTGAAALAVAGVRFARLVEEEAWARGASAWGDTVVEVPAGLPGRWRDAVTGREIHLPPGRAPLGELLAVLPFALLLSEP